MNNIQKILWCTLLVMTPKVYSISPYISIRSQGLNAARDLAGMVNNLYLPDQDCVYGTFSTTFEYDRSFHNQALTKCLFGPDLVGNCPALVISGSQSPNRLPNEWLADYFGLPTDYKSIVTFNPLIQNYIVDLNFYMGLDEWLEGLYIRVDAPIVQTKWFLNLCENILDPGKNAFAPGYFSASQEANVVETFADYISGDFTPTFTPFVVAGQTFPSGYFYELANARVSRTPRTQAGLAEFRVQLGWNWSECDYHIGLQALFTAPAGSRPRGDFAFEPIVGNGHFWEFGLGLTTHYDFWSNESASDHAAVWFEAHATHLFKSRQKRTFDLKNKPNSRYMLAQRIGSTQLDPHLANPPFPVLEYQSLLSSVANLTTFDVDVSVAVQGDVVAMLNYTNKGLTVDAGYNIWGRSCEKIMKNGRPSPLDDGKSWALKGDASVIGFISTTPVPVRLAATEKDATIHAGTNYPATGTTDPATIAFGRTNPHIDTPFLATSNGGVIIRTDPNSIAAGQINSSLSPVFINIDDVNLSGTRGFSQKIFAHLSYAWIDRCDWTPFIGCGAQLEFGNTACNSCNTCIACSGNCTHCQTCSISQWGAWIKGGISF